MYEAAETTLARYLTCPRFAWLAGTISFPLYGRSSVEEAEGIMRQVYDARSASIRRLK
jgi:hypothetical protein